MDLRVLEKELDLAESRPMAITVSPWITYPTEKTVPDLIRRLRELQAELRFLNSTMPRRRLFPFESIKHEAAEVRENLYQKAIWTFMAIHGFGGLVDLKFLEYRQAEAIMPAFMVLDALHSNGFQMVVSRKRYYSPYKVEFVPPLPPVFADRYAGFAEHIADTELREGSQKGKVFIAAEFSGMMPDSSREKLEYAVSMNLFDRVFVIAEAKEWAMNKRVQMRVDPIVVGFVAETSQVFEIDIFNPTPLEKYAHEQFVVGYR